MRFEKVTLVEFNTDKERERINNVFKGRKRTRMLDLLDRFERGDFDALARERVDWPREFAECVHPVIESTLSAIAGRLEAQALWPQGFGHGLSEHAKQLLDLEGRPVTAEGLPYPKFKQLAPADGEFVNPNDVQEHHGYAVHVLLSMAHGFLKARSVLQSQAEDNEAVRKYLAESHELEKAAVKVKDLLLGD